jgi:non-homologous end joining protein Ku
MTANELAVYLEDITDSEESPYRQAATMLRQQAEEIEALKDKLETTKRFAFDMNVRAVKAEKRELSDEEIIDLCVKQVEKLISPTEPDYDPSQWNDAIERAILKILNVKTILKQYRELKKASEK